MSDTEVQPDTSPYHPPGDAPRWFLENLEQPGESHRLSIDGYDIHFLTWNWEDEALPVLLLVHGFSGHARWWSFLAPFFTDRYRVLALDLPGMGDSGHPDVYDDNCFARAILGIIHHYQLQQVTIIGHSFGGVQTMRALALAPEMFARGIVVDSIVALPPKEPLPLIKPRSEHRQHANRADCMVRFRVMPPQPGTIDALLQYVSFHSCTGDGQGWHWKFDPGIQNYGEIKDPQLLATISARVDCIYGELSMFNADDLPGRLLEYFPNRGELIIIPGAYHHIMLDHPLELVAAINKLLASD